MQNPARWVGIGTCVVVLAAMVAFPRAWLSPGNLLEGHAEVRDCFACHEPGRGPTDDKCLGCHPLEKIGTRRTPASAAARPGRPPFHRGLAEPRCDRCHLEHLGTFASRARVTFAHDLLDPAQRPLCAACHTAPADRLHASIPTPCGPCHTEHSWKPATFTHELLTPQVLAACRDCHAPPDDATHRYAGAGCTTCHAVKAWKPSTLDHDRFFQFDKHHPARCDTCHTDGRLDGYTCYGCHEHTPGRMTAEHREEGIREFEKCAGCHRSGDEDDARRTPAPPRAAGEPAPVDTRRDQRERDGEDDDDEDDD